MPCQLMQFETLLLTQSKNFTGSSAVVYKARHSFGTSTSGMLINVYWDV